MPGRIPEQWTPAEFRELCDARRQEFIDFDIDEKKYREFLVRNGFTATEAESEVRDARATRQENALAEWRGRKAASA